MGLRSSLRAVCCLPAVLFFASCENPPNPAPVTRSISLPQLEADATAPSTPELLAPGIVSTAHGERDAAFLPDGSAFYYTLWAGRFGVIVEIRKMGDVWAEPAIASFSGRYSDLEPFVTPDGSRLFFASNRPLTDEGETKDYDIWYVQREGDAWSSPVHLGSNVNTDANEFYPSLDRTATLYYTAAYEDAVGDEDIWMSRPEGNDYGPRENAGPGVNTEHDEFNALIASDGSFLAFSSYGRDDDLGGGDLYVSFRGDDGRLGPAVNAGPAINSESLDFSPALTPDGKTFLLSSRRSSIPTSTPTRRTLRDLIDALESPGNGNLDIYLVDASFLDTLRNLNP